VVRGSRWPRLDDDTQRLGVDRAEGTDLLAAAQAAVTAAGDAPARPPGQPEERRRAGLRRAHRDHLLACLLLLNGLRISEALGLDLEDLGTMRSHRVARVRRKGGRHQDVVLAPGPPPPSTTTSRPVAMPRRRGRCWSPAAASASTAGQRAR
jgi:integrase